MRSGIRALAALCSLAISVNTGCTRNTVSSGGVTEEEVSAAQLSETADSSAKQQTSYHTVSEKDMSPVAKSGTAIRFSGDGATVSGSGVSAEGTVVTITKAGYYYISGTCPDGQIVVDCGKDDDVFIVLEGLELTCTTGPAIYCNKADKLTLTLSEGSVNSLSDGSNYSAETAEETGSAVFSRDTLVINGTGTLSVNGVYKDGIKSKDGLKLCGGSISVTAAEDGIIGKDYLLAAGGNVTVNSGLDGIKSTNSSDAEKGYITISGGSFSLTCGNDGIQAETDLNISGGTIEITSGGGSATVEHTSSGGQWGDFHGGRDGFDFSQLTSSDGTSAESMKGLKAGSSISVTGGTIKADCADDTVHSNGTIIIDGGTFELSSGDDGIHADKTLTITSGEINISTCYEGLEACGIEISGGVISLRASDDGLNASDSDTEDITPYISISGGSITSNADGDGIDSNGTISMSGGTLVVFGPTSGADGALDYDKSFAMSGGTLIALGSSRMAEAPSTLSQPCISIYADVAADSTIEVRDADGNVILSTITPKKCESLIFSTPEFTSGEVYTVFADDESLAAVTCTDGVAGGGASGSGFGSWAQDNGPWGGNSGNNSDFTHPGKPGGMNRPDGNTPPDDITPPDGMDFPDGMTPPDGMTAPDTSAQGGTDAA